MSEQRTLGLLLYRGIIGALSPFLPMFLNKRATNGKEDSSRLNERFGKPELPRPFGHLVWFHGASVGESMIGLLVARKMRETVPDLRFLFTTTTPTGAKIIQNGKSEIDIHQYVPLDTKAAVNGFINHWQPDLGIFLEGEIWPNLILAAKQKNIPLALINARITEKSFKTWKKFENTAKLLFGAFDFIQAADLQTERELKAFVTEIHGATHNLKLAAPAPKTNEIEIAKLRAAIANRPLWLAASTHEGEEELILEAHEALQIALPDLLLIIAPRHPNRAEYVFSLCGKATKRRSLGELPDENSNIYLWDTLGELGNAFAISPISLIAGSLKPEIGGHNPIEPAQLNSAIISGPYVHNFKSIYQEMLEKNAIIETETSPTDIARHVLHLLNDEIDRDNKIKSAHDYINSGVNGLDEVSEQLVEIMDNQNARA